MANKEQRGKSIKVKVFRFDSSKDKEPFYQTFEVPLTEHGSINGMSVLDVLSYIRGHYDGYLSFYASCLIPYWESRKRGICARARCNTIVNGKPCITCEERVTGDITIEPPISLGFKVIKDLIAEDVMLDEDEFNLIARRHAYNILEELKEGKSTRQTQGSGMPLT